MNIDAGTYVVECEAGKRFRAVEAGRIDFKPAKQMIEQCLDERDQGDGDSDNGQEEAFWTTALIRFRRPFSQGSHPIWTREQLRAELTTELWESYIRFRMLADKFIAHPVGIGQDMATTVEIGPGNDGSIVLYGGTVRRVRVSSSGTDHANKLLALLTVLIDLATALGPIMHRKFLDQVRTLPRATLLEGGKYEAGINFDESSPRFKRELEKYRKQIDKEP
jgi:hypothetical protein